MKRDCTYQRTDSGHKALANESSGLPPAYRKILGLTEHPTHADQVVGGMSQVSREEVLGWLDELESLGFLESSLVALAAGECYEPVRRSVALPTG
jgi:hypothetical protein